MVAKFPRGKFSFCLPEPIRRVTKGCEAEAIKTEIEFRHLIWKFLVPLHGIPWLNSHKVSPLDG